MQPVHSLHLHMITVTMMTRNKPNEHMTNTTPLFAVLPTATTTHAKTTIAHRVSSPSHSLTDNLHPPMTATTTHLTSIPKTSILQPPAQQLNPSFSQSWRTCAVSYFNFYTWIVPLSHKLSIIRTYLQQFSLSTMTAKTAHAIKMTAMMTVVPPNMFTSTATIVTALMTTTAMTKLTKLTATTMNKQTMNKNTTTDQKLYFAQHSFTQNPCPYSQPTMSQSIHKDQHNRTQHPQPVQ